MEPFKEDVYEGDYRNDEKDGKRIYYFSNGDRQMVDYYNDNSIGKHVILTKNKDVIIKNY